MTTDSPKRSDDPTPVFADGVPVANQNLQLHPGTCDLDGLWRPGVLGLARAAGISLQEARRRILEPDPALVLKQEQEKQEELRQKQEMHVWYTWQLAGVPWIFREVSFATLTDVERHDPAALQACRDWASGTASQPGLLLRGNPGNGKTCLAVAALRDVVERTQGRRSVRFRAMSEILMALQQQYRAHGADGAESLWQMLSDHAALVVDELGRRRLTDWVQEQLHMLFDMCWREGRRLVVTTNVVDPDQFDALLDPATRSRLYAMCAEVWLYGPDYRLRPRAPVPDEATRAAPEEGAGAA